VMEIEQNNDRFKTNTSTRSYLRKIMGKSALLFSSACFVGAYEAKVSRPRCEKFRRIGYNIGIAFQIIDDMLDYAGDPDLVRKPLGSDIRSGLITMPALCALRLDTSGVLKNVFSRDNFSAADASVIFNQVQNSKALESSGKQAALYTDRALKDIAALPPGENRDMLETLTRRLLVRQQ